SACRSFAASITPGSQRHSTRSNGAEGWRRTASIVSCSRPRLTWMYPESASRTSLGSIDSARSPAPTTSTPTCASARTKSGISAGKEGLRKRMRMPATVRDPTRRSWCGRSSQLHADQLEDPPERPFDPLGLGVAHDHVPLSFIAARGRLSRFRKARLHYKIADLALRLVDSVDRAHPAASLPAQEDRPGRVPPPGRIELVEHHEAGPRLVEVELVRVRDEGGELRSRRARGDFGDGEPAVGPAEPLHVTEPGLESELVEHPDPVMADVAVLRTFDFARKQHAPLHPRLLHHFERSGVVA